MSPWAAGLGLGLVAVVSETYLGADLGLARLDESERRALMARGEAQHFAELSGGVAHYRAAGPADGPPVLLVHGFSSPGFVWVPYVETLSDAGFRVLAPFRARVEILEDATHAVERERFEPVEALLREHFGGSTGVGG